ncbi:MAG TPA: hypothetical protein VGN34_08080, partial [Ktedonobacteraceae bacterium]
MFPAQVWLKIAICALICVGEERLGMASCSVHEIFPPATSSYLVVFPSIGYCQLSNNCRGNHTGFNLKVGHHPKFLEKIAFLKAS